MLSSSNYSTTDMAPKPPHMNRRLTTGTGGMDAATSRTPLNRLMSLSRSGEKNPLWHFQSSSASVPKSSARSISIIPPVVFNFDRLSGAGSQESDDERRQSLIPRYPRELSVMPRDRRRQSTLSDSQRKRSPSKDGQRKRSAWSDDQREESTGSERQRKQSTWIVGQMKQSTWGEGQRKQSTWGEGQRKQSTWGEGQRKQSTWSEGQRKQSIFTKRQMSIGAKGLLKVPQDFPRKLSEHLRPNSSGAASVLYVRGMQSVPEMNSVPLVRPITLPVGKPERKIVPDSKGTQKITKNIYQTFLRNNMITGPGGARNKMMEELGYNGEGTYTPVLQRCQREAGHRHTR